MVATEINRSPLYPPKIEVARRLPLGDQLRHMDQLVLTDVSFSDVFRHAGKWIVWNEKYRNWSTAHKSNDLKPKDHYLLREIDHLMDKKPTISLLDYEALKSTHELVQLNQLVDGLPYRNFIDVAAEKIRLEGEITRVKTEQNQYYDRFGSKHTGRRHLNKLMDGYHQWQLRVGKTQTQLIAAYGTDPSQWPHVIQDGMTLLIDKPFDTTEQIEFFEDITGIDILKKDRQLIPQKKITPDYDINLNLKKDFEDTRTNIFSEMFTSVGATNLDEFIANIKNNPYRSSRMVTIALGKLRSKINENLIRIFDTTAPIGFEASVWKQMRTIVGFEALVWYSVLLTSMPYDIDAIQSKYPVDMSEVTKAQEILFAAQNASSIYDVVKYVLFN